MLHALVIFLSAFLLFLVQPLIAKQILPWFGGSASVWATCMLFFQAFLLAGYAYAHGLTQWLTPTRQAMVHTALLLVAACTMPIIVGDAWRPKGDEEPIGRILLLLAVTIGLPYFLLASTTPLIGAWYWRVFRVAAPYRLFALSNFASLLALLGFPFLFEPSFGNRGLATAWSVVFVLFAIVCGVTAWRSVGTNDSAPTTAAHQASVKTSWLRDWPMWVLLSAMGSMLLLAISNHLTQNISSAPLLWVVPLAIYLITFIICFDHPRWYVRPIFLPLAAVALPVMAWLSDSLELFKVAPIYAAGLFVGCMVFHGELARLRPAPQRLTAYYLWMSVGGALGSLMIAVAAPLVLPGYFELFIVLVLAAILGAVLMRTHIATLIAALVSIAAVGFFSVQGVQAYIKDARFMERDFYGAVRTRDSGWEPDFRTLIHGSISHGGQLVAADQQMLPSSYFGATSGYGRLFSSLPQSGRRVGVIGLGAGSLGAWARPNDHWVFYEISPAVVRAAKSEFTFLSRMPGTHEIVLGDGRLAMEREAPRGFDVIAMDAFAGDSVPTHLITREAMAAYVKHLKPDGAIVFQATNRFVDMLPPLRNLAEEFGMQAVVVRDFPADNVGINYWLQSTDQVIVTRNAALLNAAKIREGSAPIEKRPELKTFTDDYVNLLQILKR